MVDRCGVFCRDIRVFVLFAAIFESNTLNVMFYRGIGKNVVQKRFQRKLPTKFHD
jgi:hypothetical protein